MVEETGIQYDPVPVLRHGSFRWEFRCRPYDSDYTGRVSSISQLLVDVSAMQPSQRGLNVRRVLWDKVVLGIRESLREKERLSKAKDGRSNVQGI